MSWQRTHRVSANVGSTMKSWVKHLAGERLSESQVLSELMLQAKRAGWTPFGQKLEVRRPK